MDDLGLALLVIVPVIVHATVAYLAVYSVFKRKSKELENYMESPKADAMWKRVGDKVLDRLIDFLQNDERSVVLANSLAMVMKKYLIQGIKEWMGGEETGLKNSIKAAANAQIIDVGAMIKSGISKLLGKFIENALDEGKKG